MTQQKLQRMEFHPGEPVPVEELLDQWECALSSDGPQAKDNIRAAFASQDIYIEYLKSQLTHLTESM
jgi:hypothetical protein